MQVVESGQLQILRTGSNIRVPATRGNDNGQYNTVRLVNIDHLPGHDWRLGSPLLHLKYFLQFSILGTSSPGVLQVTVTVAFSQQPKNTTVSLSARLVKLHIIPQDFFLFYNRENCVYF